MVFQSIRSKRPSALFHACEHFCVLSQIPSNSKPSPYQSHAWKNTLRQIPSQLRSIPHHGGGWLTAVKQDNCTRRYRSLKCDCPHLTVIVPQPVLSTPSVPLLQLLCGASLSFGVRSGMNERLPEFHRTQGAAITTHSAAL